jgi:hypothetical protein
MYTYAIYRAIPFVYELRTLLDWTCTDTTLEFRDFLKYEDIRSALFLVKCDLDRKAKMNRAFGQPQERSVKILSGLSVFVLLVLILCLPLVMFSKANDNLTANPITHVDVQFHLKSTREHVLLWSHSQLLPTNASDVVLGGDGHGNDHTIQTVNLSPESQLQWLVPLPAVRRLAENGTYLGLHLQMTITLVKRFPVNDGSFETIVYPSSPVIAREEATRLRPAIHSQEPVTFLHQECYPSMITLGQESSTDAVLGTLAPCNVSLHVDGAVRYWSASGVGTMQQSREFGWLDDSVSTDDLDAESRERRRETLEQEWVNKQANSTDTVHNMYISIKSPLVVGGALQGLFSGGVLAVYLSLVLGVGRFLRMAVSDVKSQIPYEDIHEVDDLYRLVEDIQAARKFGNLPLEEYLYVKLLLIFRSTEEMMKWTDSKDQAHKVKEV